MYDPESENVDEAVRLVESLRRADGVIIASPGLDNVTELLWITIKDALGL